MTSAMGWLVSEKNLTDGFSPLKKKADTPESSLAPTIQQVVGRQGGAGFSTKRL